MPAEIAQAFFQLTPSFRGLQGLIEQEVRRTDTRRAGRDAGEGYNSGFGESAKKITAVLSGAFAAVKIGDFAKDAISQASDLNEAGSKLQVVFGSATDSVNAFASNGAKSLGQSKLDVQNAAATFGVYGKAAGLAGTANADFSKQLVGLSTDLASFYNTDPAQATEAIAAGLRGESEPLRQYGILLDDATLRNQAFSMGLTDTTKNVLTPQQRVLAAQAVIMKQSSVAQGDFARTSAGLANQQRILSAQFTDMKGKLGAAFLPAVTATVTALNEHLFPALQSLGTKATDAWAVLTHGQFSDTIGVSAEDSPLIHAMKSAHDTYETLKPQLSAAWDALTTGFDQSRVTGTANPPLIDIALKLRDFGLSTFDRLADIWNTLWDTGEKLWPSIESIAGSLATAFQSLSGNGLTVWGLLLDVFQKIADSLNVWLVPALEWLAKFMRENPASVLTFVGVILAVVGAVKAWTVAQGILDALLTANPIGIVVVALAAFAAAVVWAYNNVQWFHDLIDNVWTFIQNATKFLWEQVLKPIFDTIVTNLHAMGDTYSWLWQTVSDVWSWIQDKVSTVWGFIRDDIFAPLNSAITSVGQFFTDLWNTVSNVWQWIQDKISTTWTWLRDNVFVPLNAAVSLVGSFFTTMWDTIQTVWNNVSTFFVNVAEGIKGAVATVKQAIDDILGAVSGFFTRVSGGSQSGGIFNNLQGALAPGGARGAVVPGVDPGRRDNMLMPVRSGESVFVPEFTKAIGGAPTVHAWNRAAEQGRLGDVFGPGYASGGVVGDLGAAGTRLGSSIADKISAEVSRRIQPATSAAVNLAEFNSSQDPSSFGWARAAGIVPYSWAGNSIAGGVAGGTQGLWGALLSALVPQIPGGITSQMFGYENRQNVNSPGNASFHSYGLAVDVNAQANPNGAPGYGRSGRGVIPSGPAHSLAARYGMLWGGDFTGTPDPMHFEIHLPPSAIGGAVAGTLGASLTSAIVSGSGVERWRSTVDQALALTGQPTRYDSIVLHQMDTESSGNPRAINLTDINAQRGDPSKGLLQVIGSTFNRYRLPNLSADIYDPLANIVAAIRYVLDRYGSVPAGMQGHAYANGGIVPGSGGADSVRAFLTPGEGVFTKPQTDAIITHAKALEAGFAGQMPNVVVNNYIDGQQLDARTEILIDGVLVDAARLWQRSGAQS